MKKLNMKRVWTYFQIQFSLIFQANSSSSLTIIQSFTSRFMEKFLSLWIQVGLFSLNRSLQLFKS